MIKKWLLFGLLCWGICLGGFAQGIEFRAESFDEVLRLAKEQKKWVFVDVYTETCVPCKRMEKEVFPLAEVGEFYNAHFLCLQVDADREEQALLLRVGVGAYPTYLFFNPEGELKYRTLGYMPAEAFIDEGKKALALGTPQPYGFWLKEYAFKGYDKTFLASFMAAMADRTIGVAEALRRYWATQRTIVAEGRSAELLTADSKASLLDVNDVMAKVVESPEYKDTHPMLRKGPQPPITGRTEPNIVLSDNMVESLVELLEAENVMRVKDYALQTGSREMFDYALSLWDKLPARNRVGEREALELEFLSATGDTKAYVEHATRFLERLAESVSRESLLERGRKEAAQTEFLGMREEWKMRFEEMYCDLYFSYVNAIVRQCMRICKNKKQLPRLEQWVEYAGMLKPGDSAARQLEKDVRNWK